MENLLFIVIVFAIFYLLLIRPGQRRERQRQELIRTLNPGDEVVTVGGVVGTVREIDDSTVHIDVGRGTVIRVMKRAVSHKVSPGETEQGEQPEQGS